ncbi:hypothetical protein DPMN_001760 [Dreissena polymorpha]|uniref:Uncharacterized protein n=1 Tax=Dreissena polymorpha TaxID=45954 RepID=A0A9D4MID6_DREPO|nr:hypothetical protein DPMN_001760 [Dreissena polymorpha]
MHNVTVDGKDLNNYRLSPCSVDSIAKILSDPNRTSCFKDRSLSVCGNGLVEVGEECDCGTMCYLDDGCHSSQEGNRCLLKYNTDNSNSSVLGVGSIDKTANDTACITEGRDGLCTERLNPWTNGQNTNWLLLMLLSTLCCTVLFIVVALLVWKCRPSVCFHCSSAVKSRHCARVFNASENTTDNLQLPALPNGLSKIPTEDSKTHLLAFYKTGDTVIECAPETFQKV